MSIHTFKLSAVIGLSMLVAACGGGLTNDLASQSIKVSVFNGAPLSSCANGGLTFNAGVYSNGDQTLESSEIMGTQYICNGLNGMPGTTGLDGVTGIAGVAGSNGLAGLNGSNGLTGTSGATALVVVSPELSGLNCTNGGTRVSVGLDLNENKILELNEFNSSNFICNGANGNQGLSGSAGNGINC